MSPPAFACCHIPLARSALRRYGKVLGLTDSAEAMLALARAIAASPVWSSVPSAVVVVRLKPQPLLAVMARLDECQAAWLVAQARAIGGLCQRLRLVTYRQAEAACERLAEKLTDRLGAEALGKASFVAIPRGGCIVLGLLGVALGLKRTQLEKPYMSESVLVVVDDCALSGARFRNFLDRREDYGEVVFAHLYSHPKLRTAIVAQEPRVNDCISAADLESGDFSADEAARFLSTMDDAYWIGKTEPLAFPWNEPDRLLWHPVEQRPMPGWRIVPPEACLKNRLGRSLPIQVQQQAEGPLGPGQEVLFGEFEEHVALHHLERCQSVVLDDVGSDLWRAIIRYGNLGQAQQTLEKTYRVSGENLRQDTNAFVEELIDLGYLESNGMSGRNTAPI